MKQFFCILLAGFLLCCTLPSMAQRSGKLWSLGFGLEGGIPLNDAAKVYNFSGGLTARFSLRTGPGYGTITTGWLVFVPKNIDGMNPQVSLQIPIKGGYKYIFANHFFVMGELGYSFFQTYVGDGNGNLVKTSTGGFTYAPSVGVQFGVMDFGVRYETIAINTGNVSNLGFRLGFNF